MKETQFIGNILYRYCDIHRKWLKNSMKGKLTFHLTDQMRITSI